MADTRTIHPMPMKPVEDPPTVRGPTSHSPLPMETPSAIMLGPRTYRNSCFVLIRPLILKTSSGSGKSVSGKGGRLFPICIVSPDTTTFSLGSSSSFRPQIFLQPNAYVDERPSRRLAHRTRRQCGAATDGRAVYLSRGGKGVLILDSRGADRTQSPSGPAGRSQGKRSKSFWAAYGLLPSMPGRSRVLGLASELGAIVGAENVLTE